MVIFDRQAAPTGFLKACVEELGLSLGLLSNFSGAAIGAGIGLAGTGNLGFKYLAQYKNGMPQRLQA